VSGLDENVRRELGQHLRSLRRANGLTLAELAGAVGVSISALSQIERGAVDPSLGTLWRLNDVLGSSLFDFFNRPREARVQICRSSERTLIELDRHAYQTLVQATQRRMDLFIMELDPGDEPVRPPLAHWGEECGVVTEGTMEVLVGGESHRLESGDSIWFDSTQKHTFRAVGDQRCVAVWANTLPERPGSEQALPLLAENVTETKDAAHSLRRHR
jgi:transcriptional regulator with XRE-family HTH domain